MHCIGLRIGKLTICIILKNNLMKKNYVTFLIATSILTLSLNSCKKSVDKIKANIEINADSVFLKDLKFISTTAPFLCYGTSENYWYSKETSTREILDDKFRKGYNLLGNLDDLVSIIEPCDELTEIINKKKILHKNIQIYQQKIRKTQYSMNTMDLALGGDLGSFFDFAGLWDTESSFEDSMPMPDIISKPLNELKNEIIVNYKNQFDEKVINFEQSAIKQSGSPTLKSNEIKDIHQFTIIKLKGMIFHQFDSTNDTLCRNELVKFLLDN